jgi:hypothetical protein
MNYPYLPFSSCFPACFWRKRVGIKFRCRKSSYNLTNDNKSSNNTSSSWFSISINFHVFPPLSHIGKFFYLFSSYYMKINFILDLENLYIRENTSQRMPTLIFPDVMPGFLCASVLVRVLARNKKHLFTCRF